MKPEPETWTRIKSERIADCRVFTVRRDFSARRSDAAEHTFFCIESPAWVNVIALTAANEVVLIEQFRHGSEQIELEIPGGMVDAGEMAEEAARRELLEETGFAAREMISLGKSRPNPAIQNNWVHHFLALGCVKIEECAFDATESVVTRLVELGEIPKFFIEEKITHSLVLACFHKFEIYQSKIVQI